ncbi:MAG: hypothetical protein ACRELX_01020, partial [Longimicrobiales bacterium]
RLEERVREQVERAIRVRVWQEGPGRALLAGSLDDLERGDQSPYDVAARILRAVCGDAGSTEAAGEP